MSTESYQIREKALQLFVEGNRLDFLLRDPESGVTRGTLFFNNMDAEVKLGGHKIQWLGAVIDEETGEVNERQVRVKYGRRILTMGLCQPEGKKSYFYRSLETANDIARPKSVSDILAAIESAQS